MPKFQCLNQECEKYQENQLIVGVKYRWDSDAKEFNPEQPIYCPSCGLLMEEVAEKKSLSSINFSYREQMRAGKAVKGTIY